MQPNLFGTNDIGSAVQRCPQPPAKKQLHWIEFQLVDLDDAPVPWYEYRVVLPNGDVTRGFLDKSGSARIENIPQPGACRISFPALDQEAWEALAT